MHSRALGWSYLKSHISHSSLARTGHLRLTHSRLTHVRPLTVDVFHARSHADLANLKERFGFAKDEFFAVPPDVSAAYKACGAAGAAKHAAWKVRERAAGGEGAPGGVW
eukprot:5175606-Pleurochrysis_carterae.AAC.1